MWVILLPNFSLLCKRISKVSLSFSVNLCWSLHCSRSLWETFLSFVIDKRNTQNVSLRLSAEIVSSVFQRWPGQVWHLGQHAAPPGGCQWPPQLPVLPGGFRCQRVVSGQRLPHTAGHGRHQGPHGLRSLPGLHRRQADHPQPEAGRQTEGPGVPRRRAPDQRLRETPEEAPWTNGEEVHEGVGGFGQLGCYKLF